MASVMHEIELDFRRKVIERLSEIWKVDKEEAVRKLESMVDGVINSNPSLSNDDAENQVIFDIINENEDRQLDFLWFEYQEHREKKAN